MTPERSQRQVWEYDVGTASPPARKPGMRVLDLFCGGGGAAMGYFQAGFTDIVGVDICPMPRYPFTFVQDDALRYLAAHGQEFAAIHASPPCQAYSAMKHFARPGHPALLPEVRQALRGVGRPYVIENVVGAPLDVGLQLCGTMFGLQTADGAQLRRHRRFESSVVLLAPGPCQHKGVVITCQGHDFRSEAPYMAARRAQMITITGSTLQQNVVRNVVRVTFTQAQAQEAMGIDWLRREELAQAIPPAYTKWIGGQLRNVL